MNSMLPVFAEFKVNFRLGSEARICRSKKLPVTLGGTSPAAAYCQTADRL